MAARDGAPGRPGGTGRTLLVLLLYGVVGGFPAAAAVGVLLLL